MNKSWLIIPLFLLILGCRKDQELPPREEKPLPSYIKKLLQPDTAMPYTGIYYIEASFINNETSDTCTLRLNAKNASLAFRYDSSNTGSGVLEQTVMFISSAGERLEISFYYDLAKDTAFRLCCADYLYGDPWNGLPGANVQYAVPVSHNDRNTLYTYKGIDCEGSSFKITYLGNGHVNGTFHTTWKECCGEESTYAVTGNFSIPMMLGQIVI